MSRKPRPQLKRAISELDVHVRSDTIGPMLGGSAHSPQAMDDIVLPTLWVAPPSIHDNPFYAGLAPSAREALWAIEHRLDQIAYLTVFAKGRALRQAKSLLVETEGHGRWEEWLRIRKIAATTARAHMRAADWFDETAIIADLPPGAVYRGAGAPDEVKRDIVERIGAGQPVTLDVVNRLIKDHRQRQAIDPGQSEKQPDLSARRTIARREQHHADGDAERHSAAAEVIALLILRFGKSKTRRILDLLVIADTSSLEKEYQRAASDDD